MLFEWQGILQFISQSGFSFDSAFFFFFHCSLLFYGYSKNLCRHKRGTKPQIESSYKKSRLLLSTFHTYLQKYDITFEDLFFASHSLTNDISLPLIYSIASKHVSDFSARKRKNLTLPVQFSPPHPGKGQISSPGKALQIKFPLPEHRKWSNARDLPGGMLKFRFDRRIIHGRAEVWNFFSNVQLDILPVSAANE